MARTTFITAILIIVGAASVDAAPLGDSALPPLKRYVVSVHNCHGSPQMGFVPEYGRDLYHAHDANCQAVILNGGQSDGASRAPAQGQRRVEPESKPRFPPPQLRPEQRYEDCHRNVRTHRVPGFNRPIAHRHVGPNCRIEVYERVRDRDDAAPQRPLRPGGPCIQRGSVRYCEGR